MRKIQSSTPSAVELLYLYAFLDSENIPETLVSKGPLYQDSPLQNASTNPSLLKEAHGLLSRYTLIRHKPATSSPALFYMHRLVQNVLRDLLEPEEKRTYAELAVRVISHIVTGLSFAQWDQYRNYIAHARACTKLIDEWNIHIQEAAELLSWVATYLHEQDAYGEAEALVQQSQDMLAQIGEKQSKQALDNMNHLATLYLDQGKLTEADQLYRQVLLLLKQDQEEPDQLSRATINNNLGELLYCPSSLSRGRRMFMAGSLRAPATFGGNTCIGGYQLLLPCRSLLIAGKIYRGRQLFPTSIRDTSTAIFFRSSVNRGKFEWFGSQFAQAKAL